MNHTNKFKIIISILVIIIIILSFVLTLSKNQESKSDKPYGYIYELGRWDTFVQKDQYDTWNIPGTFVEWYPHDEVPQKASFWFMWEANHSVDLYIVNNQNYQNFIDNVSFYAVFYANGASGNIYFTCEDHDLIKLSPYYLIVDNSIYGYERPFVNQFLDGSVDFVILFGCIQTEL